MFGRADIRAGQIFGILAVDESAAKLHAAEKRIRELASGR
jgi:hypothetical protein